MLHVRIIAPAGMTAEVCDALTADEAVTNLVVLTGAARKPVGDVVLCDVVREGVDGVLDRLREMGVLHRGAIAIQPTEAALSDAVGAAERATPGYGADAVIWDEVYQRTAEDASMSWSYLAFLAIATQIAAIGIVLDSPILIVGAMVLGPEFGPVSGICVGLLCRDMGRILRSLRTLAIGFVVAIAITFACAAVSHAIGWIAPRVLVDRPMTGFIVHPDRWSLVVAVLAGAAGVLSLTSSRSTTLVGVFISVTTVPAAGNIALALALGNWSELGGSAAQLGLNVLGMIVAGTVTLIIQRTVWKRVTAWRAAHRH